MVEGDGCDGWVLKEPMSTRSGEFKKCRPAFLRPVRNQNLLRADGERRLSPAEVEPRAEVLGREGMPLGGP